MRLRVANLRFTQPRGGYDKKRDDRQADHCPSPWSFFAYLSWYQF
jgi:hypothetical protein